MYWTDKDYRALNQDGTRRIDEIIYLEHKSEEEDAIYAFSDGQIAPASVDLRLSERVWIPKRVPLKKIDTSENGSFDFVASRYWKETVISQKKPLVIKPGQTVMARTFECIRVPENCIAKIEAKSSFARLSLFITISDYCNPKYNGHYPLQLHNFGKNKIVLYPYMEICQMMLLRLDSQVDTPYDAPARASVYAKFDDGGPSRWWASKNNKRMRALIAQNRGKGFVDHLLKQIDEKIELQFDDTEAEFCKSHIYRRLERYLKRHKSQSMKVVLDGFLRQERNGSAFASDILLKIISTLIFALSTFFINLLVKVLASLFGYDLRLFSLIAGMMDEKNLTLLPGLILSALVLAAVAVAAFLLARKAYALIKNYSETFLK